jgi:hypothetical protein
VLEAHIRNLNLDSGNSDPNKLNPADQIPNKTNPLSSLVLGNLDLGNIDSSNLNSGNFEQPNQGILNKALAEKFLQTALSKISLRDLCKNWKKANSREQFSANSLCDASTILQVTER